MNHIYVGIDVCVEWLDVFIHPIRNYKRFENTSQGIEKLTEYLASYPDTVEKIVMEATGGLEYQAAKRLQESGFAVAVVNAYFTASFRRMRGKITKTDAMDAEMLAMFAQKMEPEARPVATTEEKEMRELTARRVQLIEMITAEKNRLYRLHSETVQASVRSIIGMLTAEKEGIEDRLYQMIQQHSEYSQSYEVLTSIPGIGSVVAITMITELPELGQLNKKQIASLVGVAPHNRDSGKSTGTASTRTGGGRKCVKAALYMSAITAMRHNSALKIFYKRLVDKGKPKKLALVAVMRKLLIIANQMMKEKKLWQENYNPS